MKHIQKKFFALLLLTLFTTTTEVHAWGAKRPTTPTPPTTPTTPTTPTPTPEEPTGNAYTDQIKLIAGNSTCASYSWKNRGKAPAGYVKGVALSFARGLCRKKAAEETPSALVNILTAVRGSDANKDALTHYQSNFQSLSMNVTTAGVEPLRSLYTLAMGLGMRESSGKYCEGWDRSAGSNRPSSGGEAGLFQTSYDSIGASPELSKLYAEYKATPARCMLETFKQGVTCSSLSNLGTGAGADYQSFNKSCPAFATEYAMVMLRVRRNHYGPINRKEAEVLPACNQMLKSVQDLIDNDPHACEDIL